MKVRIEKDDSLPEDEILICCKADSDIAKRICSYANELLSRSATIPVYKDKDEVFLSAEKILFFETCADKVLAHTADDVYLVKYRLYELEQLLPKDFIRVSKSAVANAAQIISLNRSLSSSALIQFRESHKQVYASRMFIKPLRQRLDIVNNFI